MLKLNSVLSINSKRVCVVVVHKIMDSRGVEAAWNISGIPSDCTSILSWNTTVIETEIVSSIHLSLLFQCSKSFFSI